MHLTTTQLVSEDFAKMTNIMEVRKTRIKILFLLNSGLLIYFQLQEYLHFYKVRMVNYLNRICIWNNLSISESAGYNKVAKDNKATVKIDISWKISVRS